MEEKFVINVNEFHGAREGKGEKVEISPKGSVIFRAKDVLERYSMCINSLEKYINEYVLDDIPPRLLKRLYELGELKVVERKEDTFKPHDEFVEELSKAKVIEGYSTIFFAEYVDVFSGFAEEGKKIKIAINEKFFSQILRNYKKDQLRDIILPEERIIRLQKRLCYHE